MICQRYGITFPKTYLRSVERTVGEWIVYYEPRRTTSNINSRGGRQAYFATARVASIERDPKRENHFYAFVSDYLEFDQAVPFREGDHYYESGLQRIDGQTNKGAFGRSVRSILDHEYNLILRAGFNDLAIGDERYEEGISKRLEDEPEIYERPLSSKSSIDHFVTVHSRIKSNKHTTTLVQSPASSSSTEEDCQKPRPHTSGPCSTKDQTR